MQPDNRSLTSTGNSRWHCQPGQFGLYILIWRLTLRINRLVIPDFVHHLTGAVLIRHFVQIIITDSSFNIIRFILHIRTILSMWDQFVWIYPRAVVQEEEI